MGSKDPLGVFRGWAGRYGDIFYYRVLYRKVYFLNHPDLVKQVLVGSRRTSSRERRCGITAGSLVRAC